MSDSESQSPRIRIVDPDTGLPINIFSPPKEQEADESMEDEQQTQDEKSSISKQKQTLEQSSIPSKAGSSSKSIQTRESLKRASSSSSSSTSIQSLTFPNVTFSQTEDIFETLEKEKIIHVVTQPLQTKIKIFSNNVAYVEKLYDLDSVPKNTTQLIIRNLPIPDRSRSSNLFNINIIETGEKPLIEFDEPPQLIQSWSLDTQPTITMDFLSELINKPVVLEYRKTNTVTKIISGKLLGLLGGNISDRGSVLFEENTNPFEQGSLTIISSDEIIKIDILSTNDTQKRILKETQLNDGKLSLIVDINTQFVNVKSFLSVNFETPLFDWSQLYNFRYLPINNGDGKGLYLLNIQHVATIKNNSNISEFADILLTERSFVGKPIVNDNLDNRFEIQQSVRKLPSGKQVTLVEPVKTVFENYEKAQQSIDANSEKNVYIQNLTFETKIEFISVLNSNRLNTTLIYNEFKNTRVNLPPATVRFFFNNNSNIISQIFINRLSIGDRFSQVIGVDEDISVSYTIGSFGKQSAEKGGGYIQKVSITINNSANINSGVKNLVLLIPKSTFLSDTSKQTWFSSNLLNKRTNEILKEQVPAKARRAMRSLYIKDKSVEYRISVDPSFKNEEYELTIVIDQ